MVFNASVEPNSFPIVSILPPVLFLTSCKNPARPLLCNAATLNCNPNSLAVLAAVVEGFIILLNAAFMPVIASDVPIPFMVKDATEDNNSFILTPAALAVGATVPIELASSSTVVLPLFCVNINLLATLSTSL